MATKAKGYDYSELKNEKKKRDHDSIWKEKHLKKGQPPKDHVSTSKPAMETEWNRRIRKGETAEGIRGSIRKQVERESSAATRAAEAEYLRKTKKKKK